MPTVINVFQCVLATNIMSQPKRVSVFTVRVQNGLSLLFIAFMA